MRKSTYVVVHSCMAHILGELCVWCWTPSTARGVVHKGAIRTYVVAIMATPHNTGYVRAWQLFVGFRHANLSRGV